MHNNDKISFEWDDEKNTTNIETRGLPFAYATRIFFDEKIIIAPDERHDYGEDRFIATGKIEKRLFVVAFTVRDNVYRIISARKANSREVKRYEEFYT